MTGNGVTIIGATGLPASVPTAASSAYSRNVSALLLQMVSGGTLNIDTSDEIQAGVVVAHGGKIVHPAVAKLLASAGSDAGAGTGSDAGQGAAADGES